MRVSQTNSCLETSSMILSKFAQYVHMYVDESRGKLHTKG